MSKAKVSLTNSQADASPKQPNTDQWPPCERCGQPAQLKTQYGDLCEPCYIEAADQALRIFAADDATLCQLAADQTGKGGDRALLEAAVKEIERRCQLRTEAAHG